MPRLKAILGYTLAALSVPILLASLIGMGTWSKLIVQTTGITVSPWFTGGEVRQILAHGHYRTLIHRPVFDALIGQRRQGFVQVDWEPLAALPERLEEEIDYDGDGQSDFCVALDTRAGKASLARKSGRILAITGPYKLEKQGSWTVRVGVRNQPR